MTPREIWLIGGRPESQPFFHGWLKVDVIKGPNQPWPAMNETVEAKSERTGMAYPGKVIHIDRRAGIYTIDINLRQRTTWQ